MNISDLPHRLQSQLEHDIAQVQLVYLQTIADESVKDFDCVLETFVIESLIAHLRLLLEWGYESVEGEYRSPGMVAAAADFVDDISRRAYIEKDPRGGAPDREFWIRLFQARIRRVLEAGTGWKAFVAAVGELSVWERSEASEADPEITPAQRIEDYRRRVHEVTGRKVIKADLWRVAGYRDPSSFQRFQRGAGNLTQEATLNFERVLAMAPLAFIEALDRIKSRSE